MGNHGKMKGNEMAKDASGSAYSDGDFVTFKARVLHVDVPELSDKPPEPAAFRIVTPDGKDCAGPVVKCDPALAVRDDKLSEIAKKERELQNA